MKVKRQKHVKKYLSVYKNSFGVFKPYQVLIDGTFCQAALENKINIKEQLSKYLDAELQFLTTQCVQKEMENLGGILYGALVIAKRFKSRKCPHTKPTTAAECLSTLIGQENVKRYFVATQDKALRSELRKIPGVPLLYINYNCIVMEKPSFVCAKKAEEVQMARTQPTEREQTTVNQLKVAELGQPEPVLRRKRKRAKGPNPLSCKKKKVQTKDSPAPSESQSKNSRKRRQKRKIAAHVLDALKQAT